MKTVDELGSDYEEGSDEGEEGELPNKGEMSLPLRRKQGEVVQKNHQLLFYRGLERMMEAPPGSGQKLAGRSRKDMQELGDLPSSKKNWWSVWDLQSGGTGTKVCKSIGVGDGVNEGAGA
ncbi:hypothetical protein NDU88_003740 [Pleurodeles waltl]|uniref:Uncharacterized protein n=1 Tax=Pleurodeles waltl TaxID=8319 RepID=A0AAV7T616_PLEWA|nr:hypothetical protein NDU88_003740 [Pleurodeles waltl]